jgi:hypothetical protein
MSLRALEARPDVGLDIFQHVTEVDRAIGVGQGAGHQYSSFLFAHDFCVCCRLGQRRNYGTPVRQAVASGARKTDRILSLRVPIGPV